MELDWSTFLLEIANFLILVWILKRFLYKPVKAAIEARRERVEAALSEAEQARADADRARDEYEARRKTLEQEHAEAHAELERALAAERERRLAALHDELARERDKAAALAERERTETERRDQARALELAGTFAARLLGAAAGPELEERLLDLALDQLADMPEQQLDALAEAAAQGPAAVQVRSAYPIGEDRRRGLCDALSRITGGSVSCGFSQEPELIAGLSIDAGALLLAANLRDELRFFAEAAR